MVSLGAYSSCRACRGSRAKGATRMSDGQVVAITDSAGEWMDLPDAAVRLGFDAGTILRLIQDGDMPAMQLRGGKRTAHRLPTALINEARQRVLAGGQVELREFARQWAARNAAPAAEAVA